MLLQATRTGFRRHGRALARAAGAGLAGAVIALPAAAITEATPTDAFDAVGRGVQVAPAWVLTVTHFAYSAGATYSNGYGSWVVAARYDAPGSGDFPANDLSLLRLELVGTAAPYLAVNGNAVAAGTFAPLDVTIASAANSSGPRAYGLTTVSESDTTIDPDGSGPRGDTVVNYLISDDSRVYVQPGDSGGGLFYGHVTDSSVLMGLTSAQIVDDDGHPIGSAFVQPAAYRNWIDATMAADTADDERLLWVSAVPEPPAAWAAAAGLALIALRRRLRAA